MTYYLDAAKVVGKTERPSPLLEIFYTNLEKLLFVSYTLPVEGTTGDASACVNGVEGRSRGAVGGFNGVGTVFGVASSHFPGTKSPAGGSEHACVRCETANEVSEHGG